MKKQDDRARLIVVAIAAAVVAFILSSVLISSPKHHTLSAPVVSQLNASMPDVKNDPDYSTFLNSNSLDATQTVQVGTSQNNQPFSQ